MPQSRKASATEAVLNVLVGLVTSTVANAVILPIYGMPFHWAAFGQIAIWFTLISLARSYLLRRAFNQLHIQGYLK
jgi:hypothetical protein